MPVGAQFMAPVTWSIRHRKQVTGVGEPATLSLVGSGSGRPSHPKAYQRAHVRRVPLVAHEETLANLSRRRQDEAKRADSHATATWSWLFSGVPR